MSGLSQLNTALVRRLGGRCVQTAGGIINRNGVEHADCSTCPAPCTSQGAAGLIDGFQLMLDNSAPVLSWACPSCGVAVVEATTFAGAIQHAASVGLDAICHRCRIKPA